MKYFCPTAGWAESGQLKYTWPKGRKEQFRLIFFVKQQPLSLAALLSLQLLMSFPVSPPREAAGSKEAVCLEHVNTEDSGVQGASKSSKNISNTWQNSKTFFFKLGLFPI